jgi:hypothetical protein
MHVFGPQWCTCWFVMLSCVLWLVCCVLTCAVSCCVQVQSLQAANNSLRESLRQSRQQLEAGQLHTQLEAVRSCSCCSWLLVL